MLKGDTIIAGTSSTGTGTLTLAATPTPPGGVDFDVLARATGIGFGNSAAVLVSYTIIEYTDSTFATATAHEKGVGLLTLGGSAGIANCTLARTLKQSSATSLNSQPATLNTAPGTGISIVTAANTLVFLGPSAADTFSHSPFFEQTAGDALGVRNLSASNTGGSGFAVVSGTDLFRLVFWEVPMLAKKMTARCSAAYTGGTSNLYGRIYAQESANGRPGKLLIDFGVLGTANASLGVGNTTLSSAVHANGYYMTPGWYWTNILPVFSGGSGTPQLIAEQNAIGILGSGRMGTTGFSVDYTGFTATGGAATPAPDPANTGSWTGTSAIGGAFKVLLSP